MLNRVTAITTAIIAIVAPSLAFAQDLEPVKPFLDDKAIVVVDIDLTKVDLKAFEAEAVRGMENAKADAATIEKNRAEMRKDLERAEGWLGALKDAKADRALVVFSMPQMGAGGPPTAPVIAVVPTADDAAAATVEKTIDEAMAAEGKPGPDAPQHERIGNAVVIGQSPALANLKTIKPADRPDLAAAHAQAIKAGNGAIRIAFAPTGPMRGMVMMMAPPVVANTINNGVQTAGLNISLPPQQALNIHIKSKDNASAAAFAALYSEVQQGNDATSPITLIASQFKATTVGDTVTFSLDNAAFKTLVDEVVPSMMRARQSAARVASASNIRQLLVMALQYSNNNNGAFPETLEAFRIDTISPEQFAKITTNPQRPDANPAYIYLKPKEASAAKINDFSGRALIYEAFDGPFPADGINVGFVDGHVEAIRDEARFNELLKAAK